jgi:type IV pilus assembly protein PilB
MDVDAKSSFKDEWLAGALLKNEIIDKKVFEELYQRFPNEDYFINILVDNDLLSLSEIVMFIETALQIPVVNLEQIYIDPKVIEIIPEQVCLKYNIMPFGFDKEKVIYIACSNPFDTEREKELENLKAKYFFAFKDRIDLKISEYYSPEKIIDSIVNKAKALKDVTVPGENDKGKNLAVVKLLNLVLGDSIWKESSDIHIEPGESNVSIRFRIDGVLRDILEIPKSAHHSIINRIKIISNLNIAETRRPQYGKATIIVDGSEVGLRTAVLPGKYGEKVEIRILDSRKAQISFDGLGINGDNLEQIGKCFDFNKGLVLVAGPVGAGKTTLLYAGINQIRLRTNKIFTIEDPIEHVIDDINQVQVNEKVGVTYAAVLKAILRQDPKVILVGEIKDLETAEIVAEATKEEHLVLSTLRTNDTFSSISKLVELGLSHQKIAKTLQAVVALRLLRRLCSHCKEQKEPDEREQKLIPVMKKLNIAPGFYQSKGCASCGFTGHQGRVGIYEMLIMDRTLRDCLASEKSVSKLRLKAKERKLRNLYKDAFSLLAEGITDSNEVIRIINQNIGKEDVDTVYKKPSEVVEDNPADNVYSNENKDISASNAYIDILKLPKKILIVEDSSDMRILLRRLVERKSNWELLEAEDGLKAMEIISSVKPDVVVLDIMMPNMDGFEFLRRLRSDLSTATIPVLILTALDEADIEVKGLELGADDFLGKPFNTKVLFARIKKLILSPPVLKDLNSMEVKI